MADLYFNSDALASLTVSIYTIGYCLGPLIVAPVSEIYGRVWVLFPAYVIFITSLAVCGSSINLVIFVIFRAIMGFAGVGFVLIGPAVVADLIPVETRACFECHGRGASFGRPEFCHWKVLCVYLRALMLHRARLLVTRNATPFSCFPSDNACRSCNGRLHSGEYNLEMDILVNTDRCELSLASELRML